MGLMRNCLNFIEEETLLQTNYRNIGQRRGHIIVDRTPKCHPKLVGEGVEYSQVCANNYHGRLSLDNKKCKKIIKKIQEAISIDNLTTKWVCIFSRRAQEYIIAYKLMSHTQTLAGLDI